MSRAISQQDRQELAAFQQVSETNAQPPQAWQEIETGRYMPRRIRGSYRGGVLG